MTAPKPCQLPVEQVEADLPLAKPAKTSKTTNKMTYADAFAAALAKVKNTELVTGR